MIEFPAHKTVSVSSLIPYARNARTHSEAQVGAAYGVPQGEIAAA